MSAIWFCLVALMLAAYVLLDGFDLGVGILHLGVARTDAERRAVISTIGPVWDANEVWLLAAGGTLYFAFPALYASGFSGFYLPLMIVLWLLMLRGISLEFRSHVSGPVWTPLCDAVFCGSSALLAIFFGAALGNVVRGVPLDAASGSFFEPLWTNFRLNSDVGILDWYTIPGRSSAAYFALAQHGSLWLALKTSGAPAERASPPLAHQLGLRRHPDGADYLLQLPSAAAHSREFCGASLGPHFPGIGHSRPCRHAPVDISEVGRRRRISRVSFLLRLSRGHVDQRYIWSLPARFARPRKSGIFAND